jgi:hypothetical protein
MIKNSTMVPNVILDHYLSSLTAAELKVLLVIVRQTVGWADKCTGKRKIRDRFSIVSLWLKRATQDVS